MLSDKKNNRVRVFINALSARQGGGQTYLVNLLKHIPDECNNLDIVILAPDSLKLPSDYPYLKRIHINWPVGNPFLRAIWEKLYLPKLLRQLGADILFCPGGIIGTRPPKGCKSVTMFRNMIPFDPTQRRKFPFGYIRVRLWILQKVMLRSMLQADLVIFISEFAKNVIEKCTHKPFSKAVVIHHGISSHFRNTANNSLLRPKWLTKDDYFLYVSILDVYKAQIEVVQAYALLRQRRDTKEKLILAGPENPDYGERLRSEIARLTLENDVLIVGAIPYDQLPAIYQHAKINIFASECENCPNILLEALGAGRPLFASNRPPMPEFGGDAAVYFDPAQPDMLAERIATVIDDPVKMSDLSSKAKIRAMQYQWDETASKTWRAILELHFAQ